MSLRLFFSPEKAEFYKELSENKSIKYQIRNSINKRVRVCFLRADKIKALDHIAAVIP